MSKLTNCQIVAQLEGMRRTLAGAVSRGDADAAWRVMVKIDRYEAELRQRQNAGLNPGTEIQDSVAGLKP
jgi:hypothetical protein